MKVTALRPGRQQQIQTHQNKCHMFVFSDDKVVLNSA